MVFNYEDVTTELLRNLKPRTREVLERRFGLRNGEGETLQAIGEDFGITRERVRQIEASGLKGVKPAAGEYEPVFDFFTNQLKSAGGLREERSYLRVLSPWGKERHVFFLLSLKDDLTRKRENKFFHTLWTMDAGLLEKAKTLSSYLAKKIRKKGRPVETIEVEKLAEEEPYFLFGVLEVSKEVRRGPQGLWGLPDWSEINPRGTRDKVLIVLKEVGKPLHFREIAKIINEGQLFDSDKTIHPQTAHNELIKDPAFVLVGRGIYALRDWGYEPGTVSDVIKRTLEEKGPLSKEELVEKVLSKRLVKRNTVLLNLRKEEDILKNEGGKYVLKTN